MAISYNDWKKQYEAMTTAQQKNYASMVKGNATAEAYARQYMQEKGIGSSTSNTANTTNNTNTGSSNTYNTGNTYNNNTNTGVNNNQGTNTPPSNNNTGNWNNGNGTTYGNGNNNQGNGNTGSGNQNNTYNFDPNETLDTNKFGESNGQITVKEGTAQQTGMPDYQLDSDARMNEIVSNLNTYYQTNPEFFKDRITYNNMFHYNERDDAQKALLDSYWTKAKNINTASNFTNGSAFADALNNGKVTEDTFSALKQYNPEVYMQWQQQLKDSMDLAIANLTKIADSYMNANTEALQNIVNQLGIQAGEARDIIGGWEEMMTRTGAWESLETAKSNMEKYNATADKMTEIMKRYSASGSGASDSLIAARLQKALAPYQQQASNYYTAWQMADTDYKTRLGTANDYASTIVKQAAEDQRIFQNKLSSLGFAMQVNSYRTPEQQAALQLQTKQIQNNMELLQKSQLNDLELYNQYATAKLENQLESELSNLDIDDPVQQRANLNRVVGQYFEQYGDIIQRSQSQVVDDVLRYAQENGISVAQALSKNFIEPLQSKDEYKAAVRQNYGMNPTYTKIGDNTYITQDPITGKLSVETFGSVGGTSGVGGVGGVGGTSTGSGNSGYLDIPRTGNNVGADTNNFGNITSAVAGSIGMYKSTNGRSYAVFANAEDGYNALVNDLKAKQSGNTGTGLNANSTIEQLMGVWVNGSGSVDPSNYYAKAFYAATGLKQGTKIGSVDANTLARGIMAGEGTLSAYESGGKDLSGYAPQQTSQGVATSSDPYTTVSGYTSNGTEINGGGWITSLEKKYTEKWASNDERNSTLKSYGLVTASGDPDLRAYNEQQQKYLEYASTTEMKKMLETALQDAKAMLKWEEAYNSGWGDYHEGWINNASADGTPFLGINTKAATGKGIFDKMQNQQVLDRFIELKNAGATFGAMQESEWDLIKGSINSLKWKMNKDDFKETLTNLINQYQTQINNINADNAWKDHDAIQNIYSDVQNQYNGDDEEFLSFMGM